VSALLFAAGAVVLAIGAWATVLWARVGARLPPAPRSSRMLEFEGQLPDDLRALCVLDAIEGGDEALGEPPQYADEWTRAAFKGWMQELRERDVQHGKHRTE